MISKLKIYLCLVLLLCSQQSGSEEQLYFIGKVDYSRQKLVTAPVAGVLERLYIKAGTRLKKGQTIIDVTPFDRSFKPQKIANHHHNVLVTEVLVREGETVERYQPILSLNSPKDMQVRAMTYYPNSKYLKIGQSIEVIFDPDGDKYSVSGVIEALHNRPVKHGQLSTVEAEIKINNRACLKDEICAKHYKQGNFVKLQLTRT